MKRLLGLTIAVGLVIGLWWTREESVSHPARDRVTAAPVVSPVQVHRVGRSNATPVLEQERVRPTLEATDADPERHKAQEALWHHLRKFASDAKLTDTQWERFEDDLSELVATESAALTSSITAGDYDGLVELSEELDRELAVRCAAYMTEKQLRALRFHFPAGLVARVRQLHYLPVVTPET